MRRNRSILGILVIFLITVCCVNAADKWLQNDGFVSGGTAFYQQGFVSNEIMASVFRPDAGDYPCLLKKINTLVLDGGSGGTIGLFVLTIWEDNGGLQPGTVLYTEAYQLTAGDAFNEIDLTSENIILTSGNVRVGLEFTQNPPPSFCRDADGTIIPQTNLIFAQGVGWGWAESFGLQGDWIHRLMIDTNYSSATATPTPWTPTPTPTHTPTETPTLTPTPMTPTPTPFASIVYWDAEEYFGTDVNAILTVEDPDIDTDPMVQESVEVRVWSQNTDPYPGGLTVTLYEDGPSNWRFRSIFPHVRFGPETRMEDNILGVSEGETVYVRYIDATTSEERLDSAVWRSRTMFIQFLMPGTIFTEGDIFSCDLQFTNAGETIQVDLYVLLDVFGEFFAYPTWQNINEGLPKNTTFIPGEEQGIIQILPPFTMPAVGPSGPYYFYGAMFDAGELTIESLAADVAVAEFYFE